MQGERNARGIWSARGGSGDGLLVLLHGLGANASVWMPLIAEVERRATHRWLAPDFRGHGRSVMEGPYDYATHAADVADLLRDDPPSHVVFLGHSFGGVIAALLGAGRETPVPGAVATIGVKLEWTPQEVAKAHELAAKPARAFTTRPEAVERYLKGAGLFGLVDPESEVAAAGVLQNGDEFRVAFDTRAFQAVGPSLADIFADVTRPLRMAAGARDPMVTLAAMQRIDEHAALIEGAGHNAHWEQPAEVLAFALGDARRPN